MESDTSIEYLPLVDCTSDGKISYGIVQPGSHVESGVPIVRVNNFKDGKLDLSSPIKVHTDIEVKHKKTRLVGGEVLLSLVGSTGQSAIAGPELAGWNVARAVAVIRPSKEYSATWIHICLQTPEVQHFLDSHANTTVQKTLNLKDICELPILRVPREKRQFIETCWTAFSDKIELNRRMNETLEGMAQALFKSWFVDFDPVIDNALVARNPIPEELADRAEVRRAALANGTANREAAKPFPAAFQQTEELGWIPEGWHIRTLGQATSAIIDHRGKTPKKMGADWTESGYPAVSAKNIKDGKLVRSDAIRFVDSDLYERWMSEELQAGDLLMTSEAPLGEKLYLAQQRKWVLSQRLFGIRANETTSGVYLYHWLDTEIAKADIEGRASGTTVQGIRQSELRRVIVLTADKRCTAAFSESSDSIMAKRETNELNSEALTNLRDTLLPKLISGELRIPDAEKLAESALA